MYAASPSICVVSVGLVVACPTPPLCHQQAVSAEESGKQRQQENAREEHKQLQIKTLMFFSSYKFLREQECFLNRGGKEILCCQRLASRETNIKRKRVTVWDNVPPRGGIERLLRTETLITQELLTWFLTRSTLFEKVWLEIGKNVPIHVQGWNSAGFIYWPKITLSPPLPPPSLSPSLSLSAAVFPLSQKCIPPLWVDKKNHV